MIAPTHVTFAEFVYLLLLTTTGVALNVPNALLVAVCALLPDIDTATSTVGKVFPFLSVRIERKFGHRTLTHSIPWIAGAALCALPLAVLDRDAYVCCLTAYASHPFLDTMTVNGVKLFYPFSGVKCVFPLEVNSPHRYRLQTGGRMDKTLGLMFLVGCVPTFLIAHQGYERFIRLTQRNIEAAVRDFGELSRDHRVLAIVSAHEMLTKDALTDTVEVVGALNAQTLVFRGRTGELHTLGKEFQSDFVADEVVCFAGEPAHAIVRNIDLANQFIFELAQFLDSSQHYLFGDLTTSDKVSLPENIRLFTPVTGSGGLVRLNYATYDDLRSFGLENVLIAKGVLTVKSIVAGSGGGRAMGVPRLHRYEQLTFSVAPDDSVGIIKSQGDTVSVHEVIARRFSSVDLEQHIALNEEKVRLLSQELLAALAAIDQKIGRFAQQAQTDSIAHANDRELHRKGFLARPALEASKVAWERSKLEQAQLEMSRTVIVKKTDHEVNKLFVENSRLRARRASDERDAELRSPIRGIVLEIRRLRQTGRVQITFILKRL